MWTLSTMSQEQVSYDCLMLDDGQKQWCVGLLVEETLGIMGEMKDLALMSKEKLCGANLKAFDLNVILIKLTKI